MQNIEHKTIGEFAETAYLDYAMYVILDRALPHIGDGLKPVQRRIVYAMSELGLNALAKFKKSARTVGDVLGKYHPHGDQACYEAMVLMAQPFAYRYPLIQGQGNWGSSDDPKSFAAMRYTEAKLTPYAEMLLTEINQGAVNWVPNFDGTLVEPKLLPAQLPNVLLNGATGIAVGMATDIPPHNLQELVAACVYLLDNPNASLNDVMKIIPAPDYPTNAEIITPKSEIKNIYQTGNGTIKMRATYTVVKDNVIINALPHMASGSKILEQIAQQMQAKKLPMISDLRDESDHEDPIRLIIQLRSNRTDIESMMSHLFATTELEKSYRVNLNMIGLDGRPKVYNLLGLLREWLEYRAQIVTKRLQCRLEQIEARLHILAGLLLVFSRLEEVIKIIRHAEDPKLELMKKFKLSEEQAQAILNLRLRSLAKLEEQKLKQEAKSLETEADEIRKILDSKTRLKTLIKKELNNVYNTLSATDGNLAKRQTRLVERAEAQIIQLKSIVSKEPVTIVLSESGWIRTAKGHNIDPASLGYKSGDQCLFALPARSCDQIIVLDTTGQAFTLAVDTLPSSRGYGEPLTSKVQVKSGAQFCAMLTVDADLTPEQQEQQEYVVVSSAGYGFIVKLSDLLSKTKSGRAVLKVDDHSKLVFAKHLNASTKDSGLILGTQKSRLLAIKLADVPVMNKGKGRRLINISTTDLRSKEDSVLFGELISLALRTKVTVNIKSGRRKLSLDRKDLNYYFDVLGARGNKLPKGYTKIDGIEVI